MSEEVSLKVGRELPGDMKWDMHKLCDLRTQHGFRRSVTPQTALYLYLRGYPHPYC
jgi:hypothetical protein